MRSDNKLTFVTGLPRGSLFVAPKGAWPAKLTRLDERGQDGEPNSSFARVGNQRVRSPQQVISHAHTLAEFANQLIVSCGVGLTGIFGGKVTERTRLMLHGDRKQDAMEKISAEVDSFRRRKELRENVSSERVRDWSDVNVDSLANVVVVQPPVPPLAAYDELHRFDSLLGYSNSYDKSNRNYADEPSLPPASEFLVDDE